MSRSHFNLCVGGLLLCSPLLAETEQLAYSKRLGVEVSVDGAQGWCAEKIDLLLKAEKKEFYQSSDLQKLVSTVGNKVLPN